MDENLANSEREAFESQTPSLYTGSGKGKEKGKAKGFLKRKGPIGLIIGLIVGAGGLIGGSQMMQPFSLIEQYRETFNSMQTSTRMRAGSFMRYQMDTNRTMNPIRGKIFGPSEFKITKKQAKMLAAQGIEVDDDYEAPNGQKARVLKFDDGSGTPKIVAADADVAKRLGGDVVDFDTLYKTNADFYNGYNKGSMTWRGAIANWFDTVTVKFLRSNKITRNLFQDFQRRVDAENNGNTRAGALDMIAKGADEITERGYATRGEENRHEEITEEIDSKGNKVQKIDYPFESTDISNSTIDGIRDEGDYVHSKSGLVDVLELDGESFVSGGGTIERSSMATEAGVRTKLNDVAGKVQKGANVACTVFNVLGSIGMLVTASETLQVINLVTSYFEAIDKVKAGNGADSPMHDLTNALNEKKVNEHQVLTSMSSDGGENVSATTTPHKSEKTAMESSGIVALYSGGAVNPKDPSVQSFNFSGNLGTILGGLGTSLTLFESCGIAKVAANATSAITDLVGIAACILGAAGAPFSFGASLGGCAAWGAKKIAIGIGISVGIAVAVSAIVAAIVPTVASVLTRDLITNIGGEDLGNALTSGANIYMGGTHRANGGSLANKTEYTSFALAQQAVIADNAKYERQNRDPFDATSKYTFMGTLMGQLMKFSTISSVMSAVTSMSSSVSSSIIAMNSSTASAYDISAHLPDPAEYEKTCPYLASIGAVGDAFCNPLVITDVSTIDMDPADVINKIGKDGFLDTDAPDKNVQIDASSDLAKYILYCDNRASTFGMTDWNIVNEVSNWGTVSTGSSFVNTVTNGAIGAIPVIGDVIDVVSNEQALNNAGYVSGESCVAGNTVDKSESPNWEKAKYYQRFIEDQSLAETIGLFGDEGKSAVTAFLDEYYEEHPLDNSYEGILARYSGLTKDDVVALLDFIEYETYVANYDPSERYVFGDGLEINEEKTISFADENEERFYNIWWYNNIYDRVGRVKTRAEKTEYTVC